MEQRYRYKYRERLPEERRPLGEEEERQWGTAEELRKEVEELSEQIDKLRRRIKERKEWLGKEAEELISKMSRIGAEEIESPEVKEKPSFPTMEEWLKEIVIDPSFFMLEPRSDRLSHLLEGLEAATVIVPTDFYNILRARYETGKIAENMEREEYYPRLLNIIRQWEAPIKVDRQRQILDWMSSLDFWMLLSNFFEFKVIPASEYLGGESRFNPIDVRLIKQVLGETVGQVFYELIAVSERLKRAVISATHGFIRLCHRVKIPTYESYTEWKDNFRKKHRITRGFFIIVALAMGAAAEAGMRAVIPPPIPIIPEVISGSITIAVIDG